MAVAVERIEAVAPDQASLAAALKLKPKSWSNLGRDQSDVFAWGECQGSGSTPYRIAVALSDLGAKCTCPSRKFPCKHALGLMLHLSRNESSFVATEIPDFVNDWAGRRRGPAATASTTPPAEKQKLSLAEAQETVQDIAPDPQAEVRAAKQRERLRSEREAMILSGLDELDRWIGDILARGLAAFINDASSLCRVAAQRLVDAKAPALAARVDALPAQILALSLDQRGEAVVEALGSWHLLAEAYRRQDLLPETLRYDVRRMVGWNEHRQSLMESSDSLRMTSNWTVLATLVEVQPDKLRRHETWLSSDDGQFALLLDFVPIAAGASAPGLLVGERFAAELVFYPSAEPLRALLVTKSAALASSQTVDLPDMAAALAAFEERRARQPWLGAVPIRFSSGIVRQTSQEALWIADGNSSIPLDPRMWEQLIVLNDMELQAIVGFWDGRVFAPVFAETHLGPWVRL